MDYAKARTIAAVLDDASDETLAAIEDEVLALAGQYTPGPLRAAIWRVWLRTNPEEAAAVRALKRRTERKVYVRSGTDGMAWLSACLTDLEGAEAAALIDELAESVCAADPRGLDHRRADALLALLHGENFLRCGCDEPTCALAGTEPPTRRAHLLQILVDIETLLGLTQNPATLPNGTPLDAEVARVLAEDASWQGLLTEMRKLAVTLPVRKRTASEVSSAVDDDTVIAAASADVAAHGAAGTDPVDADVSVMRVLGRGRRHRPGHIPEPVDSPQLACGGGIGVRVARARAECTSASLPLQHGHGSHLTPPPGALTYRPSATTADLVRAAYPTCVFPGCAVAAHRCELDHRVEFDHADPMRGGWTVGENLQPLCKPHHEFKTRRLWTCSALAGGAVLWRSRTGVERITVPGTGRVAGTPTNPAPPIPAPESVAERPTVQESFDLLYEPTWWELHMPGAPPPPPHDIELRAHYCEHRAVIRQRARFRPCPF